METASDKPLFTPGPLTTSRTVREAMLRDLGSRDPEFLGVVRRIRSGLLAAAGVGTDTGWEAVPMQGSGTFGIEAVFVSLTPPEGRWLVVANGAYGDRMERICRTAGIGVEVLRFREDEPVDPARVADRLDALEGITGVATVHCETTSGIVNPVEAIAAVVAERGNVCFVDAMSAFGGIPLDLGGTGIDVLVSSANKCVEGVPGFSFALVKRELLERAAGWTRSLALDLPGQWRGLETNGQFRFTPPTHALLAFDRALTELAEEGGPVGRARR
ncbi:MAG: 2-aminoethylphosphonate--pyruvate transaminase, partial [Armatimonadota bacterium]